MAQRFNRALELMGWRVPVDEPDFDEPEFTEQEEVREVTFESLPGGNDFHPVSAPRERHAPSSSLHRIVTLHPEDYSNAREIGESFRSGVPVIMNLSDLPDSEARRIVDFAAGLVFGLSGTIERVTSRVFLLSPSSVKVETSSRPSTGSF